MTDTTITLPPNSGGPILDAETFTNQSSTAVVRERIAVCPGIPTIGQTTIANVAGSSSGNTSVVAGVGGQTVRIMRLILSVVSPTNIELMDGASIKAGPFYLQGGQTLVLDDDGEPWVITSSGNAFQINSSNTVNYTCTVWYTQS